MDLFLTNTHLLSSPDDNWWTVDYCDVFIRLSFWRHPFTAEHPLTLILTAPIHRRASIAETLMQWHISPNLMKKQTHLHLGWPEGEYIFGSIIPLKAFFSLLVFLSPAPRLIHSSDQYSWSERKHCILPLHKNSNWELSCLCFHDSRLWQQLVMHFDRSRADSRMCWFISSKWL